MAKSIIKLQTATPRPMSSISGQLDPREGLRAGLYGGIPFLVASVLAVIVSVLLPLPDSGVRLFLGGFGSLFFLCLGLLFILPARSRLTNRVEALLNGEIVSGTVVSQGRAFVAWKSWQDYTLCVTFCLPEGEKNFIIESTSKDLHIDFPVESKISALYVAKTGHLFCPAELGMNIVVED